MILPEIGVILRYLCILRNVLILVAVRDKPLLVVGWEMLELELAPESVG